MLDWRAIPRAKWGRYLVLAIALADGAGIYFANQRLTQPWSEPEGQASGELVAQAVEAPVAGDGRMPLLAKADTSASASSKPYAIGELPALMPLRPVVIEHLPAFDPAVEMAFRTPTFERPRIARLQPSRTASRRFVSAFATDIAGPASDEMATSLPGSDGAATEAALAGPAESMETAGAIEAPDVESLAQPEAPAAGTADIIAPVAPDTDAQPSAGLPVSGADAGAELPAS
jgi:hypothetical protein